MFCDHDRKPSSPVAEKLKVAAKYHVPTGNMLRRAATRSAVPIEGRNSVVQITRRQFNIGAAAAGVLPIAAPAFGTDLSVPGRAPDLARFHQVAAPTLSCALFWRTFAAYRKAHDDCREQGRCAPAISRGNTIARAKPDGHTIMIHGGTALAANMHLFRKPPVDVAKQVQLAATLVKQPTMIDCATRQFAILSRWRSLTTGDEDEGRQGELCRRQYARQGDGCDIC